MLVVMKGNMENGLYVLQGSTVIGLAVTVEEITNMKPLLWHKHLGHVSERGLNELTKQGLLSKEKLGKLPFCASYSFRKFQLKFNKVVHSTSGTLNYIHSDLWGPSKHPTLGGGRYFLTFIDDYSRKVWVLKSKDEAFEKFKEWKTMVTLKTGKRIKRLRTDNGWEFVKHEFEKFCQQEGIIRHKIVVYTPRQNGLAERMNKTILERVRCMLTSANLPKDFWGEAINIVVYLINRSPSVALDFKCLKRFRVEFHLITHS